MAADRRGSMNASQTARVDWVDYAKGFCIIMVVMMHSTLGVEAAAGREGWMHAWVAFAKPFRMPDFFLISGLFLARVIDRDWRTYIDRKVVHFIYFYVLWVTIQIGVKAPGVAAEAAGGWLEVVRFYLMAFVEPFGTLWFIYLLPVFFVVTKLARRVPPLAIFVIAAALEIAPIHTGWTLIDEFASRYVYFFAGYWLAPHIFRFAKAMLARPAIAAAGLAAWALVNGVLVFAGHADLPFMSLALGLLGAGAVVTAATLLAQSHFCGWLRSCGTNSIVIYLAFFFGMAASRVVLLKIGIITDVGTISALVTIAGVVGALMLHWTARNTPFRFLFVRPAWARLERKRVPALQPAE
jgi:uncharacterized membrane protein YcfT